MSYARFGSNGSDVYVFFSGGGFIDCCGCILQDSEWVDAPAGILGGYFKFLSPFIETRFWATADAVKHFEVHQAAGHTVPEHVVRMLLEDDEEHFPDEQQ